MLDSYDKVIQESWNQMVQSNLSLSLFKKYQGKRDKYSITDSLIKLTENSLG